jgi:sulfite dehydrogenase (cytochrome) subunit A
MISRRNLLETAGATMALAGGHAVFPGLLAAEPAVPNLPAALPQGTRSEVVMDALPGKKPLIKLTYRPPNY